MLFTTILTSKWWRAASSDLYSNCACRDIHAYDPLPSYLSLRFLRSLSRSRHGPSFLLPFLLSRFRCLPLLPSSLTCYFSPSFLEFASYPDYPSSALPPRFRPLTFVRPPQLLHSSPIFPTSPTVRIHLIHPIPLIELIPLLNALFGSLVFAMNSGSLSLFFFHQEQIKEEE